VSSFQPNSEVTSIPRARLKVFGLLALLMLLTLIGRVYFLQVIEHEKHLQVSNQNRIDIKSIIPKRGLIYDRNGILIAENQPSFTLTITPEEVTDLEHIKQVLQQKKLLTAEQFTILNHLATIPRRPYEPIRLRDRLTPREIAALVVDQHVLAGLDVEAELRRHYPFRDITAHILGYVGLVSVKDRARLNSISKEITHIGKKGIELAFQTQLNGTPGYAYIETNARGRQIKTLKTNSPHAGSDLMLSIDVRLQETAHQALTDFKRAAIVAIEVATGDILAMTSVPSYDPNDFVSGISRQQYTQLTSNPLKPLFNRAVQGQYPPGSTIKPMVALAGLDLGLINWQQSIWDPGFYQLDQHPTRYRDWKRYGHGTVNLQRALVESCDTYFYSMGSRLDIDDLKLYLNQFSLGLATGIDLHGERTGNIPSKQWKRKNFKQPWYPGETLISTIGQGYVSATPLQLAQATAILANRGQALRPRLVKATRSQQLTTDLTPLEKGIYSKQWAFNEPQSVVYGQQPHPQIQAIESQHWQKTIGAMEQVIHSIKGTGHKISKGLDYRIAGKTGTAQVVAIGHEKTYDPESLKEEHLDHALFIGFAPAEAPKIAIAVVIENGGGGGAVAAPIARVVFDRYFELAQVALEPTEVESASSEAMQ